MSEWKPIETAPTDGRRVLVGDSRNVVTAAWDANAKYWACDWLVGKYGDGPTHWQPLPPPPLTDHEEGR